MCVFELLSLCLKITFTIRQFPLRFLKKQLTMKVEVEPNIWNVDKTHQFTQVHVLMIYRFICPLPLFTKVNVYYYVSKPISGGMANQNVYTHPICSSSIVHKCNQIRLGVSTNVSFKVEYPPIFEVLRIFKMADNVLTKPIPSTCIYNEYCESHEFEFGW